MSFLRNVKRSASWLYAFTHYLIGGVLPRLHCLCLLYSYLNSGYHVYSDYKHECITKVASSGMEMRSRRSFSVNPAVEVLQRGAYNNYMERVAHSNRNYLDRVGKRG